MSPVIDRLVELRLHLDHLYELRPRVARPEILRENISLRNDVLHSLQTVCQVVIDIASELSARHRLRFQDYTDAVGNLAAIPGFPADMVGELKKLPGFRNVLIHEYVALDYKQVLEALHRLAVVEEFAEAVRRIEIGQG
ncbi:MAG TPA: DUF86 domain-containing protein [Thermoanaerobaculia bacterium]